MKKKIALLLCAIFLISLVGCGTSGDDKSSDKDTSEKVEKETDCLFAFYLGAAGNLNPLSDIKEENPPLDHDIYGGLVADVVISGLDKLTDTNVGAVKSKQHMFAGQIDHTEDHLYEKAVEINELWKQTNNYNLCAEAGKPYGIVSPYHAGSIISRANASDGPRSLPINAFSIGDIGIKDCKGM